jgi:ribosomal protein S12 methylthiotransferase
MVVESGSVEPGTEWRVALIDLGCAKNTIDSETILGVLLSEGFVFSEEPEEADLLLVNTCGFIQSAKEESIEHLLEAVELKKLNPDLRVVAVGCLAQRYGAQLAEEIEELDGVLGLGAYPDLAAACEAICRGERILDFEREPAGVPGVAPRLLFTGPPSAYLRIAEGCDNFCTYCAVPLIRGAFRSRPAGEILEEARSLVDSGVRELCLVAQDPGAWGSDLPGGETLAGLLRQLLATAGDSWIRLLYMHPARLGDDLIDLLAGEERLLRYLDLPIQHINTAILKRMGRRSSRGEIESCIEKLRSRVPDLVLRSTVICGFPGETEAEHDELLTFIREGHFQHLGAFPYSREEGTGAYAMPDQVAPECAEERAGEIFAAQQPIAFGWLDSRLGETEMVLPERKRSDGRIAGRSRYEAPDVDGEILIEPGDFSLGTPIPACLVARDGYDLISRIQ